MSEKHTISTNDVPSPVTGGLTEHVEWISRAFIVKSYQDTLGIDISEFLPAEDAYELRRCAETGYAFFHPPSLAGPPAFYERLYSRADADWAYVESKWEYDFAERFLTPTASVLDCGCGGGDFLDRVRSQVAEVRGLEPNEYGRKLCMDKGLDVLEADIVSYSETHEGRHDVVTALQVLEHVYDVKSFLTGCARALKPGGRLIIAVPNNDSFLRFMPGLASNLPPHHVGRWARSSLMALGNLPSLGLDLTWIEGEPLAASNIGTFASAYEAAYLPKSRLARSLYYRLGAAAAMRRFLSENASGIAGHTIGVVLRKTAQTG